MTKHLDPNKVISLFKKGDFELVIKQFSASLGQHPTIDMMLAISFSKINEEAKAHKIFSDLQKCYPTNPDIAFNVALVFKQQGMIKACKKRLRSALVMNQQYHPAYYTLGNILFEQANYTEALKCYLKAVKLSANQLDYLRSAASCYSKLGQYQSAYLYIRQIFGSGLEHTNDLAFCMQQFYLAKDYRKARKLFQRFNDTNLASDYFYYYYCLIEIDEKRFVFALKQLQAINPKQLSYDDAEMLQANIFFCNFLLYADTQALNKIHQVTLNSVNKNIVIFTMNLFETLGRFDEVRLLYDKAVNENIIDNEISLIWAKVLVRQDLQTLNENNQYISTLIDVDNKTEDQQAPHEEAEAILIFILNAGEQRKEALDKNLQLSCLYQLIKLFEKQKRFAESWTTIKKIETMNAEIAKNIGTDFHTHVETVTRLTCLNNHERTSEKHKTVPKMVFIVGFPRTGTTLLESKLVLLPNIKLLEETHALQDFLECERSNSRHTILEQLSSLDKIQLTQLSEEYISSLRDFVNFDDSDVLLDKMPLNGLYVDAIRLLFPSAKVVVMYRDPRDICISSLKQSMIQLYTVDQFAQRYDVYMTFLHQRLQDDSNQMCNVKYEDLVTDFDNVYKYILKKIDLIITYKAGLQRNLEQDNHEVTQLHNTPSYDQINRPIYTSSIGSYKQYSAFLDFKHPLLKKWVNKLGYAD
jgi:tetratricopeptide (TPR) repeat protein